MAQHFHPLSVQKIIRETADCVSLTFDIPASLKKEFEFKEGQNIVIKHIHQGEEIRRSYSICNAPHEQELKVAIKKIPGGVFSTFANEQLQEKETLEVMPPSGKFNAHLATHSFPNYLAIAAGSGITPVISIIKHTLYTQANSRFTLLYGNQNRSSVVFFEELEGLKNQYIDRLTIINILSREKTDAEVLYGRIDATKLSSLQKIVSYSSFHAAYLCGPEAMIFDTAAFLENNGIDKKNIHFELFTTSATAKKPTFINTSETDQGPKSKITVRLDGRSLDFDLPFNGQNILDAALQQGADLPYACKGGVCCTCRAKLLEGTVTMDVNYALEPEEVEQGFILTCQSHPTSSKVVVDFDEK
jgi:ring-1,2-phenylacetyl-CoA epoxidase subunit PaaE